MKKLLHIFTIILATTSILNASDVDFKVSAPGEVKVGERFRLSYQINADVSSFTPPTFENFSILSGPNRGQNSSIQIINGKVTQNISITYTYVLSAKEEGEFTLSPATVKVSGKEYKSRAKTIRAVKSQSQSTANNNQKQTSESGIKSDDVFIKALIDKTNLYLGEEAIVTYRIYTKIPISNLSIDKLSTFNGFWSIDLLDNDGNLQQRREIINGEEYIVADLKKAAIYPQKSGELELDPLQLSCVAQVQTSRKRVSSNDPFFDSFFNDPFFSNNYRNVELQLKSNTIQLTVKNMPAEGKPAFFNGAVGQYSLGSNIDSKEVNANEAITLKYTISGKGNVDLLPDLNVEFPPDFEVYDPKISTRSRKNTSGVSGYKTFEYTIIPRSAGEYEIPSVSFSFFDPKQKKYKQIDSDSYKILVNRSTTSNNQNITYSGSSQEDIKYLGKDIRYIFLMPFELEPYEHFFFGSSLFFIFLMAPLLLAALIVFFYRAEKKKRGNVSLMKNKNATKTAKKRLKKAREFLKSKSETEFYNETSQALWGYVSDKFNIPLSELSSDTVSAKLTDKGVKQEIIQDFVETLNNCEFARFAPGDQATMMEKVYQQGINVISETENQLK
jgi:hypothetical protein